MANPVPTTDANVLAAQARAGQAGVEAYQSAQSELEKQRRRALELAQQEAMGRGAPAGAIEQTERAVASPYDERLASLAQQQAGFSDSMASRDRRMADYNAAILSARELIGDQTAQAVAPINAQADYAIRRLQQEGQNSIDEINAQIRLEAARRAAAASRGGGGGGGRGGGGGGGGPKSLGSLNQSELREAMRAGAEKKLSAAQQAVTSAMRTTGEQQRQAGSYTHQAAQAGMRQAAAKDRAAVVPSVEWARQGASYTHQAMQAAQRMAAQARQQPTARVPIVNPAGGRTPTIFTPDTRAIGQADAGVAAARAALERAQAEYNRAAQMPTTNRDAYRSALGGRTPMDLARENAPLYFNNNVPMLTGDQLSGLMASPDSPLYADLIGGSNPTRSISGINEALTGRPNAQGAIDPRAPEALRNAMLMSAFDLADQGWKISQPEVDVALQGEYEGKTLEDLAQARQGLPGVRDQIADSQKQAAAMAAGDIEAQKAEREQLLEGNKLADQELARRVQDRTGIPASRINADPALVEGVLDDPEFGAAIQHLSGLGAMGPTSAQDVRQAMLEYGLDPSDPSHRVMLAVLEAMYG